MSSDQGSASKAAGNDNGIVGGFRPQVAMEVQPPKPEDLQKSYATVVSHDVNPQGWYGSMINTLGGCIGTLGAIPCCVCCPNPYKNVHQGNVGLVTKFGKFYKAVDPGLVSVNPLSERLIQVDVKIQIVGMSQLTPLASRLETKPCVIQRCQSKSV
jgi:erythrocyte band 7 integral membrane protein